MGQSRSLHITPIITTIILGEKQQASLHPRHVHHPKLNLGVAAADEVELLCGLETQVKVASLNVGPAVIDTHIDALAIGEIFDAQDRPQWQLLMGSSVAVHVINLAIRRAAPVKTLTVPRSHAGKTLCGGKVRLIRKRAVGLITGLEADDQTKK